MLIQFCLLVLPYRERWVCLCCCPFNIYICICLCICIWIWDRRRETVLREREFVLKPPAMAWLGKGGSRSSTENHKTIIWSKLMCLSCVIVWSTWLSARNLKSNIFHQIFSIPVCALWWQSVGHKSLRYVWSAWSVWFVCDRLGAEAMEASGTEWRSSRSGCYSRWHSVSSPPLHL